MVEIKKTKEKGKNIARFVSGVLKTKTRTKILIGVMSIICLVTIYGIINSTTVSSEEPPESDPEDPGNSPGPGLPPGIYSCGIVIPQIQSTMNIGFNLVL